MPVTDSRTVNYKIFIKYSLLILLYDLVKHKNTVRLGFDYINSILPRVWSGNANRDRYKYLFFLIKKNSVDMSAQPPARVEADKSMEICAKFDSILLN